MDFEKLDEDILSLTGTKEWQSFMQLLGAEHAAAIQNELDAQQWEEIKYLRGYRAALEFVANIREATKTLIENGKEDAAL